jgi:hypothetical protein
VTTESNAAASAARPSKAPARHSQFHEGRNFAFRTPRPGRRTSLPPPRAPFPELSFPAAGTVLCSSRSQNGGLNPAAGEPVFALGVGG